MKNSFFICIVIALLLSACTLVNVESFDRDETNLIGSAKTYSWFEQDLLSHENQVKDPAVRDYINQAIERQLGKKGYTKADAAEADLLVSWFGKVDAEVSNQSVSHFYDTYGYDAIAEQFPEKMEGAEIPRPAYSKGTLVIDVADPELKRIIWRGSATDTFTTDMADNEAAAYLNRSVRKALSAFPSAAE